MKTEDVISIALASGMYQDDDMFFSPSTGDADVHISDLEYFAKLVAAKEREACASLCDDLFLSDGEWCAKSIRARGNPQRPVKSYTNGEPQYATEDVSTKSQNVDTSAERVHESDKSIHEKTHTDHPMRHWDRTCPACVGEQEPYCWVQSKLSQGMFYKEKPRRIHTIPLYTTPPSKPWVSLTDVEIADAVGSPIDEVYLNDFRKVEAALRSKNHG